MDSLDSFESSEDTPETIVVAKRPKIYSKDYKLHELKYSTTDRMLPLVSMPPAEPLPSEEFWLPSSLPNIPLVRDYLLIEGRIMKRDFILLLETVMKLFSAEQTLLDIEAPISICGDVHGQYYDLQRLFEVGGDPSDTTYLFLGDYVDRGSFSCEVIILLFCYKITYPTTFFMLRGNHECRHLTEFFTFKQECEYKYDTEVYDLVMSCFDALPLAAIVNRQFLCIHGGLSPSIQTLDDIAFIDRFTEPPTVGPMCDLLWADPMEDFSPRENQEYVFNHVRGCSFLFSFKAAVEFLDNNGLLSIVRAHEAQEAGYLMHTKNEATGFPAVITLFSAPNYLDSYNNRGAVLRYENNIVNIKQFNHTDHPYHLPAFMHAFKWSLPFVADKLAAICRIMMNLVNDEQADILEASQERLENQTEDIREAVRARMWVMCRLISVSRAARDVVSLSPKKLEEAWSPPRIQRKKVPLKESLDSLSGKRDLSYMKRPEGCEKVQQHLAMLLSDPSSSPSKHRLLFREIQQGSPKKKLSLLKSRRSASPTVVEPSNRRAALSSSLPLELESNRMRPKRRALVSVTDGNSGEDKGGSHMKINDNKLSRSIAGEFAEEEGGEFM